MIGVDTTTTTWPVQPVVVGLDDEGGGDPAIVGAKAAALGRARRAGLPALPGFAVTTAAASKLAGPGVAASDLASVHQAWNAVSDGGTRPVVVRSSSVAEDGEASSMAGRYASVLDVRGWPAFLEAVATVVDSGGDAPMGVLVQPFLQPRWGGVLFGADPVTGRKDRLVVSAVCGGPHRLVSGEVDGVQLTLSPRGRLGESSDPVPDDLRRRSVRRALAGLARQTAAVFGSAQDIEWALDGAGFLVLLQSRPITTLGVETRAVGPLFGPGPVAETFPTRLRPLEVDLWVSPMRDGLRQALRIVGTTPARRLRRSPIVVVVDGWVAADLDVLGVSTRRRRLWARFDPRPPARRLAAAWRVGRLKVALETLAGDLIDDVDGDLGSLPELERLTPAELIRLLRRSHQTLVALHGHEVLAGMLLEDHRQHTAAAAALRVLADARGPGAFATDATDDDLVARHPVLLSLVPPQIGTAVQLPPPPASPPVASTAGGEASVREALRLRVRWMHEVTARAALAVGAHLVSRGTIGSAEAVSRMRLDELEALVESGGSLVVDLRDFESAAAHASAPLPATFRLGDDGTVVPVVGTDEGGGRGAGGGRGSGPVHRGNDTPASPGDVLVVRTLDPGLAGVLPGLSGLVAETGSVLSHLAILAREYGVPTVVGLVGASERFADGEWVVVDGTTGEVSPVDDAEWRAA